MIDGGHRRATDPTGQRGDIPGQRADVAEARRSRRTDDGIVVLVAFESALLACRNCSPPQRPRCFRCTRRHRSCVNGRATTASHLALHECDRHVSSELHIYCERDKESSIDIHTGRVRGDRCRRFDASSLAGQPSRRFTG
jgi:hypothetical protein